MAMVMTEPPVQDPGVHEDVKYLVIPSTSPSSGVFVSDPTPYVLYTQTSEGYWKYTQVAMVVDAVGTNLDDVKDLTLAATTACVTLLEALGGLRTAATDRAIFKGRTWLQKTGVALRDRAGLARFQQVAVMKWPVVLSNVEDTHNTFRAKLPWHVRRTPSRVDYKAAHHGHYNGPSTKHDDRRAGPDSSSSNFHPRKMARVRRTGDGNPVCSVTDRTQSRRLQLGHSRTLQPDVA